MSIAYILSGLKIVFLTMTYSKDCEKFIKMRFHKIIDIDSFGFMKTNFFIFSLMLCYGLNAWAGDKVAVSDSCARFEIQGQYLYDIGDIYSGIGSVTASYCLKSTGNAPLIIISSSTSCPCTTAFYDQDVILPEDSVEILLTYNIQSHVGPFLQSVLLKTNAVPKDYVWFYLKGNVKKEPENNQ